MTEQELIRQINRGDENAVNMVFFKYYERLCLYAESIIKDHQVAEEIVEDIFIYLWCNAKSIKIHVSVKNYLFRSTHNNCIKYLNKLKTDNKRIEQFNYMLKDNEILQPNSAAYPVSNLINKELEDKAEEILASLPEQCKKIYSLNRFENLSYSGIAKKLNISVGTVKKQMSRAFNKFREGLKEYLPLL